MSILVANDLFKFYHSDDTEVQALRGASLTVAQGETVALVGPSGSGKSTLLACIAGLDEPDGGTVLIGERRMTRRPEVERAALRAASIGFLAQSRNLFEHLSIAENVGLQMHLGAKVRDGNRIAGLLQLVGLADRADALPSMLSGGEAARAGLAVALANDPELLIADEPTAEVDAATEDRILDILEKRRAKGGAALIATHSLSLSAKASRVLGIADGRIVTTTHDALPLAPISSARRENPSLVSRPSTSAKPLIEARGVARAFMVGRTRIDAIRPADCAIYSGQRIALVGPSGSGKSTLLNMLAGLEEPTAGAVAWPGLDASSPLRPRQIGFVFQSLSLIPALTVIENVRLPLEIADIGPTIAMQPEEALARLSLLSLRDKLPDQLSGGQMQRVALARAIVTRPKVLFADEPTGQLDRATGREAIDALLAALEGGDTALVIATHDLTVAERMDEFWRIAAGVLTIAGSREAAA